MELTNYFHAETFYRIYETEKIKTWKKKKIQ